MAYTASFLLFMVYFSSSITQGWYEHTARATHTLQHLDKPSWGSSVYILILVSHHRDRCVDQLPSRRSDIYKLQGLPQC